MIHGRNVVNKIGKYIFPNDSIVTPIFGSIESSEILPNKKINLSPINPKIAYRMVADEMLHDGNPRYNLATFVQTYMEQEAEQIMVDTMSTNSIDKSEYPETTKVEQKCINIIADLWNVNPEDKFIGTSTVGSSEACMLAGIAMKFRWRENAKSKGIDINTKKPNIVIGSGFQVVWEKFCIYWDIELRIIPMVDLNNLNLNSDEALKYCDEFTIGIIAIMGITYTGSLDDIAYLDQVVDEFNIKNNLTIPIHVDAASGGLFFPFIKPNLVWDFRLKNVISINTSGHKYGLVYPGIGWIIWRDEKYLLKELQFKVSYLGTSFAPTFQINFSRSGSQIWAQYYNFVRFGFQGYQAIHEKTQEIAMKLTLELEKLGLFEVLNKGNTIPVVCWKIKDHLNLIWDSYDLSERLRYYGWQIPVYPLPVNLKNIIVMRAVIRADFSMEQLSEFIGDLKESISLLNDSHIISNKKNKMNISGFNH